MDCRVILVSNGDINGTYKCIYIVKNTAAVNDMLNRHITSQSMNVYFI